MKRAVIYARYSTDRQSDRSIEDQVRLCRERAEADGHTFFRSTPTMLFPGPRFCAPASSR